MKFFLIGVTTMSHENKGVRALPQETFETGERFRTPFLVCEDSTLARAALNSALAGPNGDPCSEYCNNHPNILFW